eukprot:jgi/Hompol1/816/HPOL_005431-RA
MLSSASEYNGRLPDHHPKLLMNYLLWGRYDMVKYNLSMFNRLATLCANTGSPIPEMPIPLWRLLSENTSAPYSVDTHDALFADPDALTGRIPAVGEFSASDAQNLAAILTSNKVSGLSADEQTQLLGIVSTFSQLSQFDQTLDTNGIRYLFLLKMFTFAQKPNAQDESAATTSSAPRFSAASRSNLIDVDVKPAAMSHRDAMWAFISESQDVLLDIASQTFGGKILWKDAQRIGMGLWIRNPETLVSQIYA